MKVLIAVDLEKDFVEDGALAVAGGRAVAGRVRAYIRKHREDYDLIVSTRDWHVDPGDHFAPEGVEPDFNDTWPPHCGADTPGSEYADELLEGDTPADLFDVEIFKGQLEAAFSGFDGATEDGVRLEDLLKSYNTEVEVDIVGIATDYCDKATALGSVKAGFKTRLLTDMCCGVSPETTEKALVELAEAGVEIV